jgi:hypothetical protein
MRIKKTLQPTKNGFPDGEGFNALPVAFMLSLRVERNEVKSRRDNKSASTSPPFGKLRSAPLSAKTKRGDL